MSEFKVTSITNRDGSHGPQICGIVTFTGSGLTLPNGGLSGGRGRGVIGGGYPATDALQFVKISSKGDSIDFGDLSRTTYECTAVGSATRGIFMGGLPSTFTIDYLTFSSGGGANDFGNLNLGRYAWNTGASDNVRGFVMGGSASPAPTGFPRLASIEVITMASTGDANIFGDLTKNSRRGSGCSSPTRAIHFTGRDDPARTKDIQFFTMATQGNAVKFGEATDVRDSTAGAFSSDTRGVFGGGVDTSTYLNTIDYITIASEGNATDFGDLTVNRIAGGGMSSKIRGLFCGGYFSSPLSVKDEIDYVTIATTGDAIDFGNLTTATRNMDACSDAHGGLAS